MADVPVAEGGRPGDGGPHLNWVVIGGVAGVAAVVLMLMSKSGNSGTTAAGTSINAALGSIQEQQLNMMGQLGASTNLLSSQISDFQDSTLAQLTGMQDSLTKQNTDLDTHLSTINDNLMGELGTINNGVIANGQSISGLAGQLTATNNAIQKAISDANQQQTALINTIAAQGSAATAAQQAQLKSIQDYIATLGQKSDYVVALLSTWFPALSGLITAQGQHPDVHL